jgi:ABC-type polysaccharide/polyol phosphate export permease
MTQTPSDERADFGHPNTGIVVYGGPQIRSVAAALEDFTAGIKRYGYWHNLAWNDIKTRYRRSLLGEFWMTVNLAIFVASVGAVYAILLNARLSDYLPGLTIGYALWLLFSALVIEGCQTFIMGSGTLHQQRVPLTALVLRNVDRAFIAFAHNFVVVAIVLAISGARPSLSTLLFIPGLVFWWLNGMWLSFVAGIVSARFRDIPQIVTNLVQILFLVSPILWSNDSVPRSLRLASQFNPVTHFLAIVRNPLLGVDVPSISWAIVCLVTAIGWIAAALVIRSYRTRVSLWV